MLRLEVVKEFTNFLEKGVLRERVRRILVDSMLINEYLDCCIELVGVA